MGHYLVECGGSTIDIEWEIPNVCHTVEKVMTIDAIIEGYISKLKPSPNTSDEYRGENSCENFSSSHNFDLRKQKKGQQTFCE